MKPLYTKCCFIYNKQISFATVVVNTSYLIHFMYFYLQAEEYTDILNSLEYREKKRRLEPANIIYWFKNTRAALRRAEVKTNLNQVDLSRIDFNFR